MAHWLGPRKHGLTLTPQQIADRLREVFLYVDVSRDEAVAHNQAFAEDLAKRGCLSEALRQQLQQELPEALRIIVADADPTQSDCPHLWFLAVPGKPIRLRLIANWKRDNKAVIQLAERCAEALGYRYEEL